MRTMGKYIHFSRSYRVIISHGPEFNADIQTIIIQEGETTILKSSLDHVVDTRGWIGADFHTHSSPSVTIRRINMDAS